MKSNHVYLSIFTFILIFFICISLVCADEDIFIPKISSSPSPVGSGARSLGIGAFIVGDDATASSWNPGNLVILEKPECSIVFEASHKIDRIHFFPNTESSGRQTISEENINFFSIVYPFSVAKRNMVVALTYQHLYDFNREWSFPMKLTHQDIDASLIIDEQVNYIQSGRLSAIGLSYCAEIKPGLSFGFTLNFWDNDLSKNEWKEAYQISGTKTLELPVALPEEIPPEPFKYIDSDSYTFKGFNFNLGMCWEISSKWTLGWVFKSPFTADIERVNQTQITDGYTWDNREVFPDESLDMPMSFGVGMSYKVKDHFKIAWDIYRTDWHKCVYKKSDGTEKSSVTGQAVDASDIDPTYQIRLGMEYRFENLKKSHMSIPVRAGVFYDPYPAQGHSEDIFGFNMGAGINLFEKYIVDIAYRYRWGNDVGSSIIYNYPGDFSTDVSEHILYSSLIIHF